MYTERQLSARTSIEGVVVKNSLRREFSSMIHIKHHDTVTHIFIVQES